MPSPNCLRCENRSFAVSPIVAVGDKMTYRVVFCTNCGGVVGALPS